MKSRKISGSFKRAIILGELFFFVFLILIFFALVKGDLFGGDGEIKPAESTSSPTAFLEESAEATPFLEELLSSLTPTPRPTIIYEGGVSYPTALPESVATPMDTSPSFLPEGINPLTGRAPSSLELLERRPVAIKIAIYPRSNRPVSGVNRADVVFEYYIEGGLTRFIALFYGDNAAEVGPVRSGRFFDEHVARMYQSYLVLKFADPRVLNYLKSTDISRFLVLPSIGTCPPFYIGRYQRDTYNNVFFDTTRFSDCLAKKGMDDARPALNVGYFSMMPPDSAENISRIYARYSSDNYHYWGYDSNLQQYHRYQEKDDIREGNSPDYALLTDALTGNGIATDNLIYLFVPHTFENDDHERSEIYHIDLFGEGDAVLFRDGRVIPAYWQRFAVEQPLLIMDRNRMPLPLKNGRVFYEVFGENSTYTQENGQAFFEFETP